jgi:hypothetical protein
LRDLRRCCAPRSPPGPVRPRIAGGRHRARGRPLGGPPPVAASVAPRTPGLHRWKSLASVPPRRPEPRLRPPPPGSSAAPRAPLGGPLGARSPGAKSSKRLPWWRETSLVGARRSRLVIPQPPTVFRCRAPRGGAYRSRAPRRMALYSGSARPTSKNYGVIASTETPACYARSSISKPIIKAH